MSPDDILNHFRVPGISRQCYLLLCDGAAVTVQSQQVRAFNLLYALWKKEQIRNRTVAVIGGGAAGLTFAAGAAVLDAAGVELFERYSHPMHLQSGSWHRPLHPAIYTWPADTAYRPVSHLPLLGWTTGKAHDVADQIRSKFKTVESAVNENGPKRLIMKPNATATVDPQGIVRDGNTKREFDLVILAVGFGTEENPFDLPWNSYWRVDPLDQSFLRQANEAPHIVVVGNGDGALIEILRSCVQTFDQGAFLDQVLVLTLEDRALRKEIARIDKIHDKGKNVLHEYPKVTSIQDALKSNLRKVSVTWLIREDFPFSRSSLPINRFLISQLVSLNQQTQPDERFLRLIDGATLLDVARGNGYYVARYRKNDTTRLLECDHAIVRYGAERESLKDGSRRGLLKSVTNVFSGDAAARNRILDRLTALLGKTHDKCNCIEWNEDNRFKQAIRQPSSKEPKLLARFVQRFPNVNEDGTVYRIRIWLESVPSHLTVTYYLHVNYIEDREVPSRVGAGEDHEQWINTSRDYEIRIRTSDGFEWNVGTVTNALREEATRKGSHPRVFGKRRDGGWPDDGEAFEKAVDRLVDCAKKPLPH